ncbi:MAG: mechanosensitive ion channel family protein [Polyangiaceae bacterium]
MNRLGKLLLGRKFGGAPLDDWLTALGVAALVLVVLWVIKRLVGRGLRSWAQQSPSPLHEVTAAVLRATRLFFLLGVALWAGSQYVDLSQKAERWLRAGVSMIVLLQVGIWLQVAIQRSAETWSRDPGDEGRNRTKATAVAFITKLVISAIVFVMAMSTMGFEISALIAGLGVGGVAAALAVQGLLTDLIASLSMFFDRPFDLGDFIVVGTEQGTVERIGMRSTRVRALGGEEIIFANGDLIKSRIRNHKRMQERRVSFGFGVDYATSAEQLEQIQGIAQRAVEKREGVRFDRAHFREYGPFSLEFEVVFFVHSGDMREYLDHRHAINLEILRELRKLGVTLSHQPNATAVPEVAPGTSEPQPAP